MKFRILFSAILAFFAISSIASPLTPKARFGIFGLEKQSTIEDYQKYVGETVVYLPNSESGIFDKDIFEGKFNVPYIVTSITGNDPIMVITLQEKGGKKKVKIKIYNGDEGSEIDKFDFVITDSYTVPLLLIDKFDSQKVNFIGQKFSHPLVKASYEIVDVVMVPISKFIFGDLNYPVMHFVLKNSVTGDLYTHYYENVEVNCFNFELSGKYNASLSKVERPANQSERYGETQIIENEGVTKYLFSDEFIEMLIFCDSEQFIFKLKNISTSTIKLIWNETAFVDYNGSTCKVMHQGIKYSQRESDQPPTSIIKGSSLEDMLVPTCNVRYNDYKKEWVTDSMYPNEKQFDHGELRVMLPVQIKDIINEYIFVFRLDWVYNYPELLKNY